MEISDRIAVMNHGRIEQVGAPRELYEQPANDFVMSFLGPGHRAGRQPRPPARPPISRSSRAAARGGDGRARRAPRLRGPRRAGAGRRRGAARPDHARRGRGARAGDRRPRVGRAGPPAAGRSTPRRGVSLGQLGSAAVWATPESAHLHQLQISSWIESSFHGHSAAPGQGRALPHARAPRAGSGSRASPGGSACGSRTARGDRRRALESLPAARGPPPCRARRLGTARAGRSGTRSPRPTSSDLMTRGTALSSRICCRTIRTFSASCSPPSACVTQPAGLRGRSSRFSPAARTGRRPPRAGSRPARRAHRRARRAAARARLRRRLRAWARRPAWPPRSSPARSPPSSAAQPAGVRADRRDDRRAGAGRAPVGPGGVLMVGAARRPDPGRARAARLGRYVRYMPVPVVEGFTAGIAVVIALQQVPAALGVTPRGRARCWRSPATRPSRLRCAHPQLAAIAIALAWRRSMLLGARVAARRARSRWSRWPPRPSPAQLADLDGAPHRRRCPPGCPRRRSASSIPARCRAAAARGLAVAALAALESLLSATVADGMSVSQRHDPDRELFGQGLANLAAPLFGGVPATAAIARTAVNVRAGATSRLAALTHAVVLAVIVFAAAPLVVRDPARRAGRGAAGHRGPDGRGRLAARAGALDPRRRRGARADRPSPSLFDLVTAVTVGARSSPASSRCARSPRPPGSTRCPLDAGDHTRRGARAAGRAHRRLPARRAAVLRRRPPLPAGAVRGRRRPRGDPAHVAGHHDRRHRRPRPRRRDPAPGAARHHRPALGRRPEQEGVLESLGVAGDLQRENRLFAETPAAIERARELVHSRGGSSHRPGRVAVAAPDRQRVVQAAGSRARRSMSSGSAPATMSASVTRSSTPRRFARSAIQTRGSASAAPW